VFVIRGMLPGMLFHVLRECVHFVKCSARLVVGLGADMMGRASVIRASMGSCGGILFAGSPSSSFTLCLGTLCSGTLCLLGGTYGALCRSPCGRIHLCPGYVRLCLRSLSCPATNFFCDKSEYTITLFRWHFLYCCNEFINYFLQVFIPHQKGNLAMLWEQFGRAEDSISSCFWDKLVVALIVVKR
jgi:hypothetical protein